MSLFRSPIRPAASMSDEVIERYLAALRAQLAPDPLFRRRLRGRLVNRFVAAHEGAETAGSQPLLAREMGRLGRAVLYASVALALSVTGAMAASQQAIPGEVFYPMKRQIEEIRERIVPPHLRDELAVFVLDERISELSRLADAGNATAVAAHAGTVEAAYQAVVASTPDAELLARRLALAERIMGQLPPQARSVVREVMSGIPAAGTEANPRHGGSGAGSIRNAGSPPDPASAPPNPTRDDGSRARGGSAPPEPGERTPRPKPRSTGSPSSQPDATPAATPASDSDATPTAP